MIIFKIKKLIWVFISISNNTVLNLLYFPIFLYSIISNKLEKKVCMGIIFFLALEPTIFQYHGTFWTESIFFSIQLIIMGLILNDKVNLNNFFILGIFLSLLSLQKTSSLFLFRAYFDLLYFFYREKKIF